MLYILIDIFRNGWGTNFHMFCLGLDTYKDNCLHDQCLNIISDHLLMEKVAKIANNF